MRNKSQLAWFALMLALTLALCGASMARAVTASVSGCVRDSAGVPQMGAQVQLLRADLSVAASTETDIKGRYQIASILPGRYSIKVIAESFLPSLREDVRVRAVTVVNLTLNTLYEAMQWLPAKADAQNGQSDDWDWTLRASANRPLLRWLEDGPLVVVSDGSGAQPKLKARLMATGQAGTFGESGERYSAEVEDTPDDSRELLARVDFAPGTNAGMESMLGFEQDLGLAGSVQSVAAVALHPEVECGPDKGLEEAAMLNSETIRLGAALEAEAGSTVLMGRLNGAGTLTSALPFAGVKWRRNTTVVSYRMATAVPPTQEASAGADNRLLPWLAEGDGRLRVERGLHQEIGWERHTDASGVSVSVYEDRIENPVIEAAGRMSAGDEGAALFDPLSGLLRAAGPGYRAEGVTAGMERGLPGGNWLRLSYASGSALVMPAEAAGDELQGLIDAARPRRAQAYSITLSGTLEGTNTRWQASYRWQPEDTLTEVAPFALPGPAPYLDMNLRQQVLASRDGSLGIDALLNVENLLAQGYRPLLMPDGSLVVFSQNARSFSTGLAFTF
jgi:hypothetical protein